MKFWRHRRRRNIFSLRRFPFWLRVIIAGWLSFSAVFGIYLANYASVQHQHSIVETPKQHKSPSARRNLIIVAHGRSGSSITGDIFNHHPDVFYMYEPLQTVERTQKVFNLHYDSLVQKFLTDVLQCKFTDPVFLKDIETYYRKPLHPRISHAIASPPLCPYNISDPRWDPRLCPKMTSEALKNTCKNGYMLTVIKVLLGRMPDKGGMEKALAVCDSPDIDCKIVLLVRDPRAVIPSSLSVSFYHEEGGVAKLGTRMFSYKVCKETEESLNFVKRLSTWQRNKVKVLRYEDFARNPLEEMKRLFDFAGLSVLDSVTTWLNESTHPDETRSDMKIRGSPAAFTVDDAQIAMNRWRWKVHPYEINIIEYYCRHVMQLMGYKPVDGSHEQQADISISLLSDDYEVKDWERDKSEVKSEKG